MSPDTNCFVFPPTSNLLAIWTPVYRIYFVIVTRKIYKRSVSQYSFILIEINLIYEIIRIPSDYFQMTYQQRAYEFAYPKL